jgi:cytoskeletal protein CcmA (bactofilin family)
MSLWKDNTPPKQAPSTTPAMPETREPARFDAAAKNETPAPAPTQTYEPERTRREASKESLIASDITIEGKIEGSGSVRIAGKFKGDVNVQGDLMIESGARLTGSVRADKVVVAGELEGNIEGATRVDLQQSGAITGDVKAGSFTVAAGARMRGQAVFGWDDGKTPKAEKSEKPANGSRTERGADA